MKLQNPNQEVHKVMKKEKLIPCLLCENINQEISEDIIKSQKSK